MGIFIIGGANLDIKAASAGQFRYGTSNPGIIWKSVGGVGRNIAHNLALLGSRVSFCSAVGEDEAGREILDLTEAAGVDVKPVLRSPHNSTGTYISIEDGMGELVGAVSDMRIMSGLSPEVAKHWSSEIRRASCIAADTNLSEETLLRVSEIAVESGTPLLIEPVSVEKIARIRRPDLKADWITPNADELRALMSIPLEDWNTFSGYLAELSSEPARSAPGELCFYGQIIDGKELEKLFGHSFREEAPRTAGMLVTLGSGGVLLLSGDEDCTGRTGADLRQGRLFPALPVKVHDPNGAGDAFAAGFLHHLYGAGIRGSDNAVHHGTDLGLHAVAPGVGRAIYYGQACAAITLESEYTVAPGLSAAAITKRFTSGNFSPGDSK